MDKKLETAYAAMLQGDMQALADVVADLKALPKTADGIFDLSSWGTDMYEVAAKAYPVYCAYETVYNKKEGYLDLMEQLRVWKVLTDRDYDLGKGAKLLQILINVIRQMSPEIYEYYRELIDIFRSDVKHIITAYYKDGAFTENGAADEQAASVIRECISRACSMDVLLAEKYDEVM